MKKHLALGGFDSVDAAGAGTIAGHIAVASEMAGSEPRREIRVWSSDSKAWVNLQLGGDLIDIIGWVDDGAATGAAGK